MLLLGLAFGFIAEFYYAAHVGPELVIAGHLVSNLLSARITDVYL